MTVTYKLIVTVVDIDRQAVIDSLETLLDEIKTGMLTGHNRTTKDEKECSYNYSLTFSEN